MLYVEPRKTLKYNSVRKECLLGGRGDVETSRRIKTVSIPIALFGTCA